MKKTIFTSWFQSTIMTEIESREKRLIRTKILIFWWKTTKKTMKWRFKKIMVIIKRSIFFDLNCFDYWNLSIDELVYKAINDHQTSKKKKTKKRILDKPVELYVELLLVTDRTIFEDHKRYAQTDDNDLTFLHIRTYFTHYINGV